MNKNKLEKVYPIISFCRQDLVKIGYTEKEASEVSDADIDYIVECLADNIDDVVSSNNTYWGTIEQATENLKKTLDAIQKKS